MLALLLRPQSSTASDIHRRPHQTPLILSGCPSTNAPQPAHSQMKGSGVERYHTPPPLRPAAAVALVPKLGSSSYAADVGPEALDQRSSPQSRQRPWHHPYMNAARGAHGSSPPGPIESEPSPTSRAYDLGHAQDTLMAYPRPRSPIHRSEHRHPPHEPRPRAGTRVDLVNRAQPVHISSMPSHLANAERTGGIGPSRTRGRSSTLSLPHADTTRVRGSSFIGGRHHSPSYAPYGSYEESTSQPPRSWEEARSYRDVFPRQQAKEAAIQRRQSPTLRPSSGQSPILFAPLSPNPEAHLLAPPARRVSGQMSAKMVNPSVVLRGPQYRSRPGTPVSPLNMDSLTMEDTYLPSASGMAVPVMNERQRSPADVRGRNDYFDAASVSDWRRSSHMTSDMARSPPSGRLDRGPITMHARPVSSESDKAHNLAGQYAGGQQPGSCSSRGSISTLPAHPAAVSHADQIERERFIMAQHHAHGGGPHDVGYQSEFAPQQGRMGQHGSGFVGAPPHHALPVDRIAHSRRRRRPPYSYSSMITQAIASSAEGRMTLREIYTWISTNFSGYPMSGPDSQGWQNTVRHNLSLGKIFIKKARTAQDIYDSCSSGNPAQSQAARGKGGWWTLHPVVLSQIRSGQRTHSDEFDDLERLVDLEDAATASAGAGADSGSMKPSWSAGSAHEPLAARRSSMEVGPHKTHARQRSYSDSTDPTQGHKSRPSSADESSIAPVTRQGSISTHGTASAGRSPRVVVAPHPPPVDDASSGRPPSRDSMPSVLQRRSDFDGDERPSPFNRMRGHTIAMHETPSHQYTSRHEAYKFGGEQHPSTRPPSGSVSSPRPLYQARRQMDEDVEMEPSVAMPRDSSLVLQEARETLVSAQQQRLHSQQREAQAAAEAESPESAGRMAIQGLLNS